MDLLSANASDADKAYPQIVTFAAGCRMPREALGMSPLADRANECTHSIGCDTVRVSGDHRA
jgi:hypothetical protein